MNKVGMGREYVRSGVSPVAREEMADVCLLREKKDNLAEVLRVKDTTAPIGDSGLCLVGNRTFDRNLGTGRTW